MIDINQKHSDFDTSFFSSKITLIYDPTTNKHQEQMMSLLQESESNAYYGILGRENNMIPFLSIQDNLLLGISKKDKQWFISELSRLLFQFKLQGLDLETTAMTLSKNEQLVLQMLRAIVLKQTIFIIDPIDSSEKTSQFLFNLMPILKRVAQLQEASLIISSHSSLVAESPYYDHCLLINNII